MLGFQLKGSSKRQKIVTSSDILDEHEKDVITAIEGSAIKSSKVVNSAPLVIPLVQPPTESLKVNYKISHASTANDNQKTDIDRRAAEEVIRDLTGDSSIDAADGLVIAFNSGESDAQMKKVPLLMRYKSPEMMALQNDNEKFKFDMKQRANDMDVRGEAYDAVPVEQFGAALLRGMGWTGPTTQDSTNVIEQLVPREQRLGLGAKRRALDPNRKNNREQTGRVSEDKINKSGAWSTPTENLHVGCVVYCHGDERALVVATKGVPGLNKVRVKLERSNELIEISRTAVSVVAEAELQGVPYRGEKLTERDTHVQPQQFSGSYGDSKVTDAMKRSCGETKSKEKCTSLLQNWLRDGIRVKIVSKKVEGGKYYLKKATVIDVPQRGYATLQLESDSGKRVIIEDVKERQLETVLPDVGSMCTILAGQYVGLAAQLLEKNRSTQRVIVQLVEDLDVLELDMDYVAANS